ncbi:YetF domain-containing protein [Adhaeribacter radiodurans]|uniref:DUF421 domain-containing protein n=1 Tax=Adhaeribacter radiodurans TaxID=2745197 RepID=A0A7L7L7I9_9BACT|nr:YetF domain-containing protein [Adhaeribacter radiodurans]QMU28733.1 DUF421 domain-containing protein [Adhaeribacter radiodurans]
MKKEEIYLGDWQRLLLGNSPWEFMLEVFIRTIIIYVALLITWRLLGKRMNAQLTITELAVMITLGGIASVPMQLPDKGILLGILGLACAVIFQRGYNYLTFKSRKAEVLAYGDVGLLVKDGVLQLDQMREYNISKEQVFAGLRSQKILHLGEVKRAYLESSGLFSIFKEEDPKPGLSVLPEKDEQLHQSEPQDNTYAACLHCGNIVKQTKFNKQACPNCQEHTWTYAVAA